MAKKKSVKKAEKPKKKGSQIKTQNTSQQSTAGAIQPPEPTDEEQPKLHKLKILSKPEGADIMLNNNPMPEKTPQEYDCPEGVVTIIVGKEGYSPWVTQMKITRRTVFKALLVPEEEKASDADVLIDRLDVEVGALHSTLQGFMNAVMPEFDKINTQLAALSAEPKIPGDSKVIDGTIDVKCTICNQEQTANVVGGKFTCKTCRSVQFA